MNAAQNTKTKQYLLTQEQDYMLRDAVDELIDLLKSHRNKNVSQAVLTMDRNASTSVFSGNLSISANGVPVASYPFVQV